MISYATKWYLKMLLKKLPYKKFEVKHLLLLALLPVFAQAGEVTENYNLPRALQDCHIYYVPCDGFLCDGLVITTCQLNDH